METKYTLYVGLNDKDAKVQKVDALQAKQVLENLFKAHNIDGATVSNAYGLYKHDDGTFVTENTLRIELLFVDDATVHSMVDAIKIILNQESVAVQKEVVQSELW